MVQHLLIDEVLLERLFTVKSKRDKRKGKRTNINQRYKQESHGKP